MGVARRLRESRGWGNGPCGEGGAQAVGAGGVELGEPVDATIEMGEEGGVRREGGKRSRRLRRIVFQVPPKESG